ncbi:MAG: sulfotransferase domain-containing protein [Planctomycetota bacterium]
MTDDAPPASSSNDPRPFGRAVLIASHRRSGTHLLIDLLRKQFDACRSYKRLGEPRDRLYLAIDDLPCPGRGHTRHSPESAREIVARPQRPILKTHFLPDLKPVADAHPDFIHDLTHGADRCYVVRDGRTVLCSLFAYARLFSEPPTFPEFLRQRTEGLSRPAHWARHVRAWRDQPGVLTVTYESIVKDTRATLDRLAQHLGHTPRYRTPLLPKRLRSVWRGRLDRLLATRPESTAIIGILKTPRWQSLFTADDARYFEQETDGLLAELGYASDTDWTDQLTPPSTA